VDKLTVTVPPTTTPVSLSELKLHLRLGASTAEDAWLLNCLQAATIGTEKYLEASLVTQTRTLVTERLPFGACGLRLPYPPIIRIVSVKYLDAAGAQQTIAAADYRLVASHERAELWPAVGLAWPYAPPDPAGVEIVMVCGYGGAIDVPQGIQYGILVQAAELYEHREWQITGIPVTGMNKVAENLLAQYRNLDTV